MPRVGSSSSSTSASWCSTRASATFCWLPPERCSTSCSLERALTLQPLHPLARPRHRASPQIEPTEAAVGPQAAVGHVVGDRLALCASPSPLRSSETSPSPARLRARGVARGQRSARCARVPRANRIERHQAPQQLGASRTDQPGQRPGSLRAAAPARRRAASSRPLRAFQRQHDFAGCVRHRGKQLVDVAADHQRHDVRFAVAGQLAAAGHRAVAQHDVAIGDAANLFQEVADVDDRDARAASGLSITRNRFSHVVLRERTGGFVEHDHLGVDHQCPGDLDHLLIGDREPTRPARRAASPARPNCVERLAHATPLVRACRTRPSRRCFLAEHDVFDDAQVGRQVQFLIDHGHAGQSRGVRTAGSVACAGQFHPAAIRRHGAAENLSSACSCRRRFRRSGPALRRRVASSETPP